MYIIMEHCGDGDMADLLQREGILEESAVRTIAQQLGRPRLPTGLAKAYLPTVKAMIISIMATIHS